MLSFIPLSTHNFVVTVPYSTESVYFDTFTEADQFARLNEGTVRNKITYKILSTYKENQNTTII